MRNKQNMENKTKNISHNQSLLKLLFSIILAFNLATALAFAANITAKAGDLSVDGDVNATKFYGNGSALTGILTQTTADQLNSGINQNITDTRASINNNITSVRAEINNNITDVRNSVNLNRTNLLINISSLNTTLGKKLDRGESLTDGSKIANGTDANLLNLNVTLLSVGLVPTNRHNVTIIGTVNISNSSGTGASLFINQKGDVGIGTSTPVMQLEIEGVDPAIELDGGIIWRIGEGVAGSSDNNFWIRDQSNGYNFFRISGTTSTFNPSIANLDFQISGDNNANLFYVDAGNDKIGIGTATPTGRLQVNGTQFTTSATSLTGIVIDSSGVTAGSESYGSGLEFTKLGSSTIKKAGIVPIQTNADDDVVGLAFLVADSSGTQANAVIESMRILAGGNVGIGTITPTHTLNVVGTTNFTGNSIFGGSTITLDTSGATTINQKGIQLLISQTNAAGSSLIDIQPISSDGSSQGLIRFFRLLSTTSANSAFQILPGDNTGNVVHDIRIKTGTTTVWNEQGYDMDFRWEGDNDPNLLYLDAGNGRVGINKTDPAQALDVKGSANISNNLYVSGGTNSISNITGRLFALSLNSPSGHAGIDIDIASGINKDGGAGGNVNIARGSDASGGSGAGGNAGTVTIAVGGDATPSAIGGNGGAVNIGSGGQGDGDVGGNGATITMAAGNTGTAYGNDGTVNIGTSLGLKNAVLNVYGTINDLSPYWDSSYGSALDAVMNLNGSNGELNDTSLPVNVRGKYFILNNGIEFKANESLTDANQIQDIISKEGITDIELANASVVYKRDIGAYVGMLTEAIKELKIENDLMRTELCKKDNGYIWCK